MFYQTVLIVLLIMILLGSIYLSIKRVIGWENTILFCLLVGGFALAIHFGPY
jgi:hypothetical protein